jgi:Na+-translocating ferredoxin:NAD+ oxidoreductase RnfG subunit
MPLRASILFILLATPLFGETVYLEPAEALRIIFQDSKTVEPESKTLTHDQRLFAEKKLGYRLSRKVWNFYVAKSGLKTDGYALIDHEIGKTEPITVLTALTPEGSIKEVEVLVYREPIGSEVHEKRFLKQYQGKKGGDPVRTGQDISSITGATLSARAVSVAVKRALLLWQVFYGR